MSIYADKIDSHADSMAGNTMQQSSSDLDNFKTLDTALILSLISLLTLIILLLQYIFQTADNNRLLSWQWVINRENILLIFSLTSVGMFIIYKLCSLNLSRIQSLYLLLAGSFTIAMLSWSLPEFMVDSGRYFGHAKYIQTQGFSYFLSEWGTSINAWTDLPLTSLINGSIFTVFGENRTVIQIINTLFYTGSIYITYLIGAELWSKKHGMYAAFLMLAIPYLHIQPSQLMVDISAMFFISLAILISLVALKRHSTAWSIAASFIIVCALLTKYSAWIALSSLIAIPLAYKFNGNKDHIIIEKSNYKIDRQLTLIISLCCSLLGIFIYFYHAVMLNQIQILMEYQLPAFQRWKESHISTFFYQIHPFVTLLAISSLFFSIKHKDARYLIPFLPICIILLMETYRSRYLIIIFPMLTLISAYAICQIKNELISRFITGNAIMVAVFITLVSNINFLHSVSASNIKNAGAHFNTINEKHIAVVILDRGTTSINPEIILPMLDYYTYKEIYSLYTSKNITLKQSVIVKTSPLRFTWEINYHPYLKHNIQNALKDSVIALIYSQVNPVLPDKVRNILSDYHLEKTFNISDKVFQFQTKIKLYRKNTNSSVTG